MNAQMNEDLQFAIVGTLLNGGDMRRTALDLIREIGFKPDYITKPELRTVYEILVAEKTNDDTLLRKAVVGKVSVETLEKAAGKAGMTSVDVERHLRYVKDAATKAKVVEIVNEELQMNATGENFLGNVSRRLGELTRGVMSQAATEGFSLAELQDPIPEEQDPDCLIKGEFLSKGAPLVLVAPAGEGKSVIVLQFAYAWALGRPALGIAPIRPLKIGIFQTEDSDRKMARIRTSMRQGYARFHEWTSDDLARAEANIRLFPMHGEKGDAFVEYVRRVQGNEKTKCDLIVVNPLQGVAGFDISKNVDMTNFMRDTFDRVIKLDDETKCGVMIVHHTNKPPAPNQRGGYGTDQYAQYVSAGAADLSNWMRSMLSIIPTGEQGVYKLVAAKNGEELGWPRLMVNGKPTAKPTKIIRHSTPDERVMFWHETDATPAPSVETEKPSVTKDAARLAGLLKENALPLTEARKLAKELLGRKRGDAAYEELIAKLSDYEVVIAATGISTQKVIGSEKSVENAISTLRGKHLQDVAVKFGKTAGE